MKRSASFQNLLDSEGVRVNPKKVEAILEMETPKDQSGLRRFLGMVNQLSKYQPRIAELSKPLRDLLSSKNHWSWGDAQQQAFSALKQSLASTPTLAHLTHHPMAWELYYCRSKIMTNGALLHTPHEL